MSRRTSTFVVVLLAVASLLLWEFFSKHGVGERHINHSAGTGHTGNSGVASGMPREGGQAAFSALIEMVALLESDADTDWAKVDIDALRDHLRDMDQLILWTDSSTEVSSEDSVQYKATGQGNALQALHRMVPMHAKFIAESRGWDISTDVHAEGVEVVITGLQPDDLQRLEALGFYGFMSLDAHHQAHHLMMALGKGMH